VKQDIFVSVVLCHFQKKAVSKNIIHWNVIRLSVWWKCQVTSWCINWSTET
jgi:hypothetical protein